MLFAHVAQAQQYLEPLYLSRCTLRLLLHRIPGLVLKMHPECERLMGVLSVNTSHIRQLQTHGPFSHRTAGVSSALVFGCSRQEASNLPILSFQKLAKLSVELSCYLIQLLAFGSFRPISTRMVVIGQSRQLKINDVQGSIATSFVASYGLEPMVSVSPHCARGSPRIPPGNGAIQFEASEVDSVSERNEGRVDQRPLSAGAAEVFDAYLPNGGAVLGTDAGEEGVERPHVFDSEDVGAVEDG